jgi:hypothetical protein
MTNTTNDADLLDQIVGEILTQPEIVDDPAWDTYALTAEVLDDTAIMSAFRYAGDGPPQPTRPPGQTSPLHSLRNSARDADGRTWDVMVLKIHRDTAQVGVEFLYGDDAPPFVSNSENYQRLAHELRPTAADFDKPID